MPRVFLVHSETKPQRVKQLTFRLHNYTFTVDVFPSFENRCSHTRRYNYWSNPPNVDDRLYKNYCAKSADGQCHSGTLYVKVIQPSGSQLGPWVYEDFLIFSSKFWRFFDFYYLSHVKFKKIFRDFLWFFDFLRFFVIFFVIFWWVYEDFSNPSHPTAPMHHN